MLLLPLPIFKGRKSTTFLISMIDDINIQYINISFKFPCYIEMNWLLWYKIQALYKGGGGYVNYCGRTQYTEAVHRRTDNTMTKCLKLPKK
jgi:hypothetical protein